MKTLQLASIGLLLMASTTSPADPNVTTDSDAVRAVLTLTDQMNTLLRNGDAAEFGRLLSLEFVASDPSNTIRNRDELIAVVSSGRLKYDSIETDIDFAKQLGDNLVVVMGTESTTQSAVPTSGDLETAALAGTLHRRFTNVFRKEDDSWRLLVKQSTIISIE